jgi:hypothetical protein
MDYPNPSINKLKNYWFYRAIQHSSIDLDDKSVRSDEYVGIVRERQQLS